MMRTHGLPLPAWVLLLATVSACGEEDRVQEQARAEPEPLQARSFQRTTGAVGEGIVDRLPASLTRTVLIPATNLFPEGARIDTAIETPAAGEAAAIAGGGATSPLSWDRHREWLRDDGNDRRRRPVQLHAYRRRSKFGGPTE